MIRTASHRLWLAMTSIPSIRPENLLPILIMLILWVGFSWIGLPEETAFVLVVVIAESYAVWRNLPTAAAGLKRVRADSAMMLFWPVVAMVVLAAVQLVLADALFTQRVLSAGCAFVLVIMVLGILREQDVMDRVTHDQGTLGQTYQRVSLLRINAIAAAAVIAVNEALIANGSLSVWITVMPLFALVLHGFYWFMVLLVMPPEDERARS
jgi:hypothetical protein